VCFRRSTFGHSVISTTNGGKLLITKTYTDTTRKGFTVEDTAKLVLRFGELIGQDINDSIVTSNGGDLRIHYCSQDGMKCLKRSRDGVPLLFRGEENYGITSALILSGKA
jgi:hypothetical protein